MACRSSLTTDVKLTHPFMCQKAKLEDDLCKDTPRVTCYPFRTSTSNIGSCYIVVRATDGKKTLQILSLRPVRADSKAFESTDKLFRRLFDVTEIAIVDANMEHSEDVQLLTRLLQCLMQQGILIEGAINEDDVVRLKCNDVLTAAKQGFEEVNNSL